MNLSPGPCCYLQFPGAVSGFLESVSSLEVTEDVLVPHAIVGKTTWIHENIILNSDRPLILGPECVHYSKVPL